MAEVVGLVTCREVGGVDAEDAPLLPALEKLGIQTQAVAWDDPEAPWEKFGLCVVRSPWDYFKRYPEFLAWLEAIPARARVLNPPELLRWNSHKGYLAELAARGIPMLPTELIRRGTKPTPSIADAARRQGWREIVLKPAVSGGAWRTHRHTDFRAAQAHLEDLLRDVDAMVQPYDPEVETVGERSLIFFDGELSHAVRKRSAFELAKDQTRAEVTTVEAAADEAGFARRVLAAAWPTPLLYARVDLLRGSDGRLRLMELEVLEPSLFLTRSPGAADRLARAIAGRLRAP